MKVFNEREKSNERRKNTKRNRKDDGKERKEMKKHQRKEVKKENEWRKSLIKKMTKRWKVEALRTGNLCEKKTGKKNPSLELNAENWNRLTNKANIAAKRYQTHDWIKKTHTRGGEDIFGSERTENLIQMMLSISKPFPIRDFISFLPGISWRLGYGKIFPRWRIWAD